MKVDNNIPIPKTVNGRPVKYPWAELKVGDSFFMENGQSPYSMVKSFNKNKARKPIKITTKKEGNGIRVWRIE